jgi:hypothetical protein
MPLQRHPHENTFIRRDCLGAQISDIRENLMNGISGPVIVLRRKLFGLGPFRCNSTYLFRIKLGANL